MAKHFILFLVDIEVDVTAYHKGYFVFKLCENNTPQKGMDAGVALGQSCFDKHILKNAAGESK